MEDNSLPYLAEYAKSGRAACKGCKNSITKDSLRLAVMVQSSSVPMILLKTSISVLYNPYILQSRFFDGKSPNWHHFECFFGRCRPKDVAEIEHFQSLRWEDQEKIRKKIESLSGAAIPSSSAGKGKKRNLEVKIPNLNDFIIDYAKSAKSKCKLCQEFISKNELRISKKDYESEAARQYGPHERWHHVDCFLKVRHELKFFVSGVCLPGYKTLSPDDQKIIKMKIPEEEQPDNVDGSSPTKKMKESIPKNAKDEMKKQNKTMFKYRDELEILKKSELVSLLEYNDQQVPEGIAKILDRLADAMTFGALKKCEKCNGQLVFASGVGYTCTGHISEWARCENKTSKPNRVAFKVPKELKKNYDFLNEYKGKVIERIFIESSEVTNNESNKKDKVVINENLITSLSLQSLQFFIHKVEEKRKDDIKSQIKELGGKIVAKLNENITAIISTNDELKKKKISKILSDSKDFDIPVLSSDFLSKISKSTSREELIDYLKENKISSWGSEIEKRIPSEKDMAPKKSSYPNKSEMFKSSESVKKITLKDGLVVDPDSNLDKIAHVYTKGSDIYSIVLSLTDIQTNRNSYYKLQILESDKKNKYWLFRAWGRIGTTIGGNKVEQYSDLNECTDDFKQLFEEKTGNVWELRKDFKKVPGKMMLLDVNYKEEKDKEVVNLKREVVPSLLHKAVQDLITLIFDIEAMKRTMLEFELDLVKMPLGKISQKQIQKAFQVLSDLQDLIKSPNNKAMITDRTNRFYTLVPHDCGTKQPPLLSSDKDIQQKIDVLNNLMEIEIAYKLMQECQESGNSIDDHYKKLNTEIVVVERDTDEFKFIETYVKNTHAKTHMNYSLEIQEIFKIERKGEARRFKKFMKLPNRKLLWHGSRLTNFAGILSQGLRIAPPEAPATGYMFGKGIYFADMVSKSANYCMTSNQNPIGLILLCEVALGEMMELTEAKYIEKLPPGNHSVKGMGKTTPNPKEKAISPSGAEVPLGVGVNSGVKKSSLLYNEYIVYDVAQVKIQYLIRMKFNHNV